MIILHFLNRKFLFFILFIMQISSQTLLNPTPAKAIIIESQELNSYNNTKLKKNAFTFTLNQNYFFNTNLPNIENHNGLYVPKGYGLITGILGQYNNKYFELSAEPRVSNTNYYPISLPKKPKSFSVMNDVPLNNKSVSHTNSFRNMGLRINYNELSIGYGNWDQWWGPGIHNSISLTNNAMGFYHYYLKINGNKLFKSNLIYDFKYLISSKMTNINQDKYFLSAWFLTIKMKNIEIGASRNILSGGNYDLNWTLADAASLLVTNKYLKYWDEFYDLYLLYNAPSSGLKIFLEIGIPNRSFNDNNPDIYQFHGVGSNLGLRKYGVFGIKSLMYGFEYTRLVQGLYYNILPTPNWYDNIKYSYSSYNNRRWAAHSGADSDDFLIYFGYINKKFSIKYGINYERHGVNYHFPPEVKFESRLSLTYNIRNTFIYINYENEYFEHYGFVDSNSNVWEEIFEPGSVQRTNTLIISIERTLSF